jgi:ABC-type amino acid transport substrate-binding protein
MKLGRSLISLLLALIFQLANAADYVLPATLRIGTSAGYPPLTFKQDDQVKGVEADLATAIAEDLNVTIRLVEMPWGKLIPALNDKEIDIIMSGMSITEERSEQVLFTDAYMKIGQMALIRSADLVQWSQPTALYARGARVGVKSGTTGETFAKTELSNAIVTSFGSIEEGTDALTAEKIDIFIHDAPTIWRLSANTATQKAGLMGLYRPLTDEYLAWAVRRQDEALANTLNQSLARLKDDGSLGRILGRWIPVQVKVRN